LPHPAVMGSIARYIPPASRIQDISSKKKRTKEDRKSIGTKPESRLLFSSSFIMQQISR
jgi:hypothetical protein